MQIYTSYFANMHNIREGITPVSIALRKPVMIDVHEYQKLAPTQFILNEYKKDGDKKKYIQRYKKDILSKLNPEQVIQDLWNIAGGDVCLLCYEKSGTFCHRNIVSHWLYDTLGIKPIEIGNYKGLSDQSV